jgi:predicted glycogen debranching enzyme
MSSRMIEFGKDICSDLDAALEREWLETNGIGGFASSTITGINTRRYHGLLTAALAPPVGRYVLLSKLEETVFLNGEKYDLSSNLYPTTVYPEGYRLLSAFRLDPFPVFTFRVGGIEIEKRVFMIHGENTTVVEYRVLGNVSFTLEVRPLIAFRDYHSTTHANSAIDQEIFESPGMVSIEPYGSLPRLFFAHNARWISREGNWYFNFEYPRERERGLDFHEDLFAPLTMQFELSSGSSAAIVIGTEAHDAGKFVELMASEVDRRRKLRDKSPSHDRFRSDLEAAGDQFVVRRGRDLHTIIAGYHWFSDWGRDTMIALPGLTLVTKRFEIARDILLAFSRVVDCGMLPNRFPDGGESPEYNTMDASLWYFEAVRHFVVHTQEYAWVENRLYPALKNIIDWHLAGTRYGIHCDHDGLIRGGDATTQLTWMDAKAGDYVVTPRHGKPVEIQALWYNALCFMASLARRFGHGDSATFWEEVAARAHSSFNDQFWNAPAGCLFDVVDGTSRRDASIRPNQVFALSLGHPMLSAERALSVLAVIERELLTRFGLRTLSPTDPHYQGKCAGAAPERDASYHQGTVWPWLLGPFATAYLRYHGAGAHERIRGWLSPFREHLSIAGLGTISEIFDGDPPHFPRGAIAQAWSVAEILRVQFELSLFQTQR